jgi:hypothetical protein
VIKRKVKKPSNPLYRKPAPKPSRKPKRAKAVVPVAVAKPKREGPTSLRFNSHDKELLARLGTRWGIPGSLLPVLRKAMEVAEAAA